MENNLYATPNADLNNTHPASESVQVYSPTQVACGALISGPVGLIYFLIKNFDSLGKFEAKTKTLYCGVALVVLISCIIILLPEDTSFMPFTIAYVIAGRLVAENYQLKKSDIEESENYRFQSNWKTFGMGFLTAIASLIILLIPVTIFVTLGVDSITVFGE